MRLLLRRGCVLALLALREVPAPAAQAPHFSACAANTGESATVVFPVGAVAVVDAVPLVAGDEVAVFTPAGLCAGTAVWTGAGSPLAFPAWSDDPMTPEVDGLRQDEPLRFRVWVRQSSREVGGATGTVEVAFQPCGTPPGPCRESGTYAPGAVYLVQSLEGHSATTAGGPPVASDVQVGPVVPNPVRSTGHLTLVLDRDEHVRVEVLDLLGRHLATLHEGLRPAMSTDRLPIEAGSLAPGLYLLRVRGSGFDRTLRFSRL